MEGYQDKIMEKQDLRVLLIEDNTGDAFIVKFYLDESKYANFELIHEEDLNKGIELAANQKFDIVLLDLHFADSDEINALVKFQKEAPGNFVIVMTGMYTEDMGLDALKLGAQDYLLKGAFDSKVFNNAVRYAYERFKANKEKESLSDVFDRNINRFNFLQELSQFYYFELMDSEQQVFLSTKLNNDFFNCENRELSYQDFVKLFDDNEKVLMALTDVQKKPLTIVTTNFKDKKVKLMISNNLIAPQQYSGVIQFLD